MHVVSLLSGGLDSTVLAYQLHAMQALRACVSFNYGQRHAVELRFAEATAAALGVPLVPVDITHLRDSVFGGSSQTSDAIAVPHGHYADASMRVTVVPNRNMIMLALATGVAIVQGASAVAYAAHAGDHAIYPDCRPAFGDAMHDVMGECHYEPLELLRPFIQSSKADIVQLGHALGVPFERTWSCYEGGDVHCGQCGTCVERREAFALAGVSDPTVYHGAA